MADEFTKKRVAAFTIAIGRALDRSAQDIRTTARAAILHDVDIDSIPFTDASEIVAAQHESYDGTGFPKGLKGGEIPLGARILRVADALDACFGARQVAIVFRPRVRRQVRVYGRCAPGHQRDGFDLGKRRARQQLRRRILTGDPQLDRNVLGQRVAVDHQHRYLVFRIQSQEFGRAQLTRAGIDVDEVEFGASFGKRDKGHQRAGQRCVVEG